MTASRAKEEAMTCADDDEEDLAIGGSSDGDEDDEDQMGGGAIVSMGARLAKGETIGKTLQDCDMCGLPITTDVHKHKGLSIDAVCKAGVRSKITFQDAKVRRPILAVSDSTKAGNLVAFDQDESVIIPRDSDEGKAIRDIIKKARRKVCLELEQGVYQIPAWIAETPDDKAPFQRQGSAK